MLKKKKKAWPLFSLNIVYTFTLKHWFVQLYPEKNNNKSIHALPSKTNEIICGSERYLQTKN